MIVVICAACVLLLLYYLATANSNYWKSRGVPFDKPFLIFGSFYETVIGQQDLSTRIRHIYSKYKTPYVGLHVFTQPYLMIRSPDLIKKILVKDFDKFVNRNIAVDESVDPIAFHSLGSAKDQVWKNLRSKISPVFTTGKMKLMFPLIKDCAKNLSTYFDKHNLETLEIFSILKKYTVDTISSCAFGINAYSLEDENSKIFKMAIQLLDSRSLIRNFSLFSLFFVPKLANIFKVTLTDKFATDYFINVFKNTLKEREEKNIVRNDLIDLLNNLKTNESSENNSYTLDDIKMAAQAIVFFSAGNDTTASSLSFTLYELAVNNEIQDRLRQEINQQLEQDGDLTFESLQELKYLDMVVNETLRKYPLGAFLNRIAGSDYTFEETGLTLKKGESILIPVSGLHYDPEYFPNPEKFDPERFNDQNKRNIKQYTYLSFGDGPRACIGERFARLVAKVALAYLIKDFTFETTDATSIPLELNPYAVFMQTKDGVKLRARKICEVK